MEIKFDRKKDYPTNSNHREQIMTYLSWLIAPFSLRREPYEISSIFKIPRDEVESILKELENENKTFPLKLGNSRNMHYMLKADILLRFLMKIKNSPKKPAFTTSGCLHPPINQGTDVWVSAIQDFVLGKSLKYQIPSYADSEPLRYVLMCMPSFPEWMPFFQEITPYVIDILFHEYKYIWTSGLLHPDITCLTNGYFENKKLKPAIREKYKLEFALYEYILSGRLNEIPCKIPEDTPEGMYCHAIYHQYKGDISEALELYSESLKGLGSQTFDNTLTNFLYAIALVNDSTTESKKVLNRLFVHDYPSPAMMPARLLALYATNEDMEPDIKHILYNYDTLPPLVKVLIMLITRHYRLQEKIKIKISDEEMRQYIDTDHLKLLQLECSQDFTPYIEKADRLIQEIGFSPLLPPFQKADEWERVLALLWDKSRELPQKNKIKKKAEMKSRIIYRIDQYYNINPYLQKSKDGIVWSKGRIISLTAFQQGMPEMNETDHALTLCIQTLSNDWEARSRMRFNSSKAIMQLAGYPLVFSEENPTKQITIRKEEPQINVTQTANGFKVESNVNADRIEGIYTLKREKGTLIKIIELHNYQRDIILALNRVSIFPLQAEKRLTEVLRELSKTFVIHSNLAK